MIRNSGYSHRDREGSIELGDVLYFDNVEWIICHIDTDKAYLAARYQSLTSQFNATGSTSYANSTLYDATQAFEAQMSRKALNEILPTTIYDAGSKTDVTSKIFVATKDQIQTEFDFFKKSSNRPFKDKNDATLGYITSTCYSASQVWAVTALGSFLKGAPETTYYFRPFCALAKENVETITKYKSGWVIEL